jgi:2,5-diketo-D-gluconate reductase A
MINSIPNLTLNDSHTIPQLGFGVFQVPPAETETAVAHAVQTGYRHIDTAAAYRNESGVGAPTASSGIPRDELFVTTKLFQHGADVTPARIAEKIALFDFELSDGQMQRIAALDAGERTGPDPATFVRP